jgi:hypothetical protein
MSLNFPPPLKVKNVCACVVINVILKEKSDYFCHSGHSDLGQKGVFRGAIFPPFTHKKRGQILPFFNIKRVTFPLCSFLLHICEILFYTLLFVYYY